MNRRAFLKIVAAAGASACVPTTRTGTRAASPTPSARVAKTDAPTPQAPPRPAARARTTPFEPLADDAYPNAKRVAGRFVQRLTTYGPDQKPRAIVRRAARDADDTFDVRGVLRRTQELFRSGMRSRGEVVYPQLGGLDLGATPDRICVMVVVRQDLLDRDRTPTSVTRTVDVRLVARDDRWRVEDVADAGGADVRTGGDLPPVAVRVLDDRRIELPDSARWDILRGDIDKRLLATMADLADVSPYAVAVLKSGHPHNVFGTDLVSGHTLGRGVDVWRVAGRPVVEQHSKSSAAYEFTRHALEELEVPELGSPWDLDGPPVPGKLRPSFTDAVHADHIHIAFKAA